VGALYAVVVRRSCYLLLNCGRLHCIFGVVSLFPVHGDTVITFRSLTKIDAGWFPFGFAKRKSDIANENGYDSTSRSIFVPKAH